ncbi:MAG: hypothetical protein Q9164_007491 [Protoblastenia rupestris]
MWRETHYFASEFLHSRASPPDSWTIADALAISSLHSCVEYWSEKFVTEMFNTASAFAYINAPPAGPLSQNEKNRIQRAFYRFEVYQNLYRDPTLVDVGENRSLLYWNFSDCENEQLACVHDYLFRAICPAYNNVFEQRGDVFTAVDLVEYGNDFDADPIQKLLSKGLVHLQQIVEAGFDKAQQPDLDSLWSPANNTLYAALKEANRSDDGVYLSEYTQEEQDSLVQDNSTLMQDPDCGPLDAWAWAHQGQSRSDFVYSDSQIALRARGYCMWDRVRLEQWHIFQKAWEAPKYPYHGDEQMSRKAEMQMWCEKNPRN